MKKLLFVFAAAGALLGRVSFPGCAQLVAAEKSGAAPYAKSGVSLYLPNKDMAGVARAWERVFGGKAVVSERARPRRVSIEISASSKSELRTRLVAALRENGIYVIERADGAFFDTEPEPKPAREWTQKL